MGPPTSTSTTYLRSLYRSLLRELPPTPSHQPFSSSPLRRRIRASFASSSASSFAPSPASPTPSPQTLLRQRQEAEQFIEYIKAQRMYATLLERYNPGMGLDSEEERVRLTARRVGMEMPREWYKGKED